MKKIGIYVVILTTVIIGSVFALFFFGIIWFNNPSRNDYPVQGIDVSNHQGVIDWKLVQENNIDFAYLKATEGGEFVDKSFAFNWSGARKHDIATGAYHFFTLCKSGEEQAKNFISIVPVSEQSLPPAIDLEYTGNCKNNPKTFNFENEFKKYFNTIKNHYHRYPVVYTTYEFSEKYNLSQYSKRLWIRNIFKTPSSNVRWKFWQYSNRRHINGISGYVDGNVFNGSRQEFQSYFKK
jgi:lysozyme